MTRLRRIEADAPRHHLQVTGALHPKGLPGVATLILLGPDEPAFWSAFQASPEYRDGEDAAMDRWSRRVIGGWADALGAQALYPFGGPPFQPFVDWALASGRCWLSPVSLLVHDRAGLFLSFRGALGLPDRLDLPDAPTHSPCKTCADQPCRRACPVAALTADGYDVAACKSYLTTSAGQHCLQQGCAVRRACPISARYGRVPEQSAYHMRAFL